MSLTVRHGRKPRILYLHDCRLANPSAICLFSLPGIWPDGADGTDVNSVDRSKGKQLVATGDDFGNVNLYRYPCVSEKVRISFRLFSFVTVFSYCVHNRSLNLGRANLQDLKIADYNTGLCEFALLASDPVY